MSEVSEHRGDGIIWRLRSVRGEAGRTHLGFGACSHPFTAEIQHAFSLWAQLRHHDVLAVADEVESLTSVAVLMTPRTDGRRPWDTTVTAVSGDLNFSGADLTELRSLWPTPTAA